MPVLAYAGFLKSFLWLLSGGRLEKGEGRTGELEEEAAVGA